MTENDKMQKVAKSFREKGRHAFFLDIDGTMIAVLAEKGVSPHFL